MPDEAMQGTHGRRSPVRISGGMVLLLLTALAVARACMSAPVATTSGREPGTVFRDCEGCPEMVVIPAGSFTMGSSASEQSWAASHGAKAEWVSDESPQHKVSLRAFALGRYDVTRGEYAAFVRETGHPAGDGCVMTARNGSSSRT